MNQKALQEIGLTPGESKVYLALLKLGETTTGKIIQEAGISAGKVYQILDKLIKKGLASYITKEKTKHFSPTNPKEILNLIQKEKEELEEKEEKINLFLPSLIENYNKNETGHKTKLFKGLKGLKSAIFELLDNSKKEILGMGLTISKDEKFNMLWENWHRQRARKKIECKCLFSEINKEYTKKLNKIKYTKTKVMKGITPSAITISENYVLIQTYNKETSCLLIKNEDIAQSFKTFFETMWGNAFLPKQN